MLRRAQLRDVPDIARILVVSWQATYRGVLPDWYLDSLQVEEKSQRWRSVLQSLSPRRLILVAEQGTQIIGFVDAGANREENSEYLGELYALYLHPASMRCGWGGKLVQAATDWMRQVGMHSMSVSVLRENWGARNFYQKLGGKYLGEKVLEFEAGRFIEVVYGWSSLPLAGRARGEAPGGGGSNC